MYAWQCVPVAEGRAHVCVTVCTCSWRPSSCMRDRTYLQLKAELMYAWQCVPVAEGRAHVCMTVRTCSWRPSSCMRDSAYLQLKAELMYAWQDDLLLGLGHEDTQHRQHQAHPRLQPSHCALGNIRYVLLWHAAPPAPGTSTTPALPLCSGEHKASNTNNCKTNFYLDSSPPTVFYRYRYTERVHVIKQCALVNIRPKKNWSSVSFALFWKNKCEGGIFFALDFFKQNLVWQI